MSHLLTDHFSKSHHKDIETFLLSQNPLLLLIVFCDVAQDHLYEKSKDVCCMKCSNKIKMIGTDYQNSFRKSFCAYSYSEFVH